MRTRYLVDTSAFLRLIRMPALQEVWRDQIEGGVLSICPATELEIFYTARSTADRAVIEAKLGALFTWAVVPDSVFDRAVSVQEQLTDRGAHRSAGPIDLLLAAAAEQHGMTVLHYDSDFVQVAAVTGQPTRWVADPGTID